MKITIKKRKPNSKGIIAMYIETYMGYTKDQNGKIKHNREYKKLDAYLYDKPSTAIEKNHNKEMLQLAEAVKAQLTIDIKNNQHGFKTSDKSKTLFFNYFQKLVDDRRESKGNHGNWLGALKHLKLFCPNQNITFQQIDKEFINGFKDYLQSKATTTVEEALSNNTTVTYFNKLRACLNDAFQNNIIASNPFKQVKGIKAEQTQRSYLTIEEVRLLVNAECRYQVLKNAFLFSCLSGLRWSDIHNLTWEEVKDEKEGARITFRQQKTKGLEYLDISPQARKLLGERKDDAEKVFLGTRYTSYHNLALQRWVLEAGITKQITFHCARHTFATLQLTNGTDIYTLSKLLGHKELKTTQVYATVIDQTKKDAVNRIPSINL